MEEEGLEQEEQVEEGPILSEVKLKKLKNLKYFREWSDDDIIKWYKKRNPTDPKAPPEKPPTDDDEPVDVPIVTTTTPALDTEEYKKKYNAYLVKFRKEYSVDMNETNDAEQLKQLVRYILQSERANEVIMEEQSQKTPDHRVLKGMGDFQRSLQMNINELQDKLGITRKQRKEKSVDDIPQYIKGLQAKAKDFWNRMTVKVMCEKCNIELVRYWLLFADKTKKVSFTVECEKCASEVVYVA